MDRKEMVNVIYNIEKLYVDLVSREEWQKLAEMTDDEIKVLYDSLVGENDDNK